ncbi:hypothetical protein BGX38DRAFT_1140214 [Terfezia claveryi]|nr:hypothetical protein BGX38DRAFT_1140214 [Terfezia claveryi]
MYAEFWNVTSNKILLEYRAREEEEQLAAAQRLQREIADLEAQRRRQDQANNNRREREALEHATQAFLAANRPRAPSFTPSPVQQKPSGWIAGSAAWLRPTTLHQRLRRRVQAAGPVARFLRKKEIEREHVDELVEKNIEQAGQAPPGNIHGWLRSFSETLSSAWATRRPRSQRAVGDGLSPSSAGSGGAVGTPTRAGFTEDGSFTPYEQRLFGRAMEGSQSRDSVQGNPMPAAVPPATPRRSMICNCSLTPLLSRYAPPITNESWPRYPLVHQRTCPKSPYFRPDRPRPGGQKRQREKPMNGLHTGLTPFLPNQAGPSRFLGNPFTPVKTKFYNTSWDNVHFEEEQRNQGQGNAGAAVQNTGNVTLDTGLDTPIYDYREPALPTNLEDWEKRYLSAELRAKDLLREKKEREEAIKARTEIVHAEAMQRQREENDRELTQLLQIQRGRKEIQRRSEEERVMKMVSEQQRIEEQAIRDRLAEIDRKEIMARHNDEASQRIQNLRELEEKRLQEQNRQEEYQRWIQQEQELRNSREQQRQDAERARLFQQQQQERLQRDIAEQERQQYVRQQYPQLQPQRQGFNVSSSPSESMVSWTTAPMRSVARPDNSTPRIGGNIGVDQRWAGHSLITPQTNAAPLSAATPFGTVSTNTTPIPAFWGTSSGAAQRGVEWTPAYSRTSFGKGFSSGIPVTIEEESESMDLDVPQSTNQMPLIPRYDRMDLDVPQSSNQAPLIPRYGPMDQDVPQSTNQTHRYGYGSGTNRVPVNLWPSLRHTNGPNVDPIQPGFALATPESLISRARQATQNNFFYAKRRSGDRHRSVTPNWGSTARRPNSDPGTGLTRGANMQELDFGELILMRQQARQLQKILNSRRVPKDAVENLWMEGGLRFQPHKV